MSWLPFCRGFSSEEVQHLTRQRGFSSVVASNPRESQRTKPSQLGTASDLATTRVLAIATFHARSAHAHEPTPSDTHPRDRRALRDLPRRPLPTSPAVACSRACRFDSEGGPRDCSTRPPPRGRPPPDGRRRRDRRETRRYSCSRARPPRTSRTSTAGSSPRPRRSPPRSARRSRDPTRRRNNDRRVRRRFPRSPLRPHRGGRKRPPTRPVSRQPRSPTRTIAAARRPSNRRRPTPPSRSSIRRVSTTSRCAARTPNAPSIAPRSSACATR